MTPTTLSPHEVLTLQKYGRVTLVRPVVSQPLPVKDSSLFVLNHGLIVTPETIETILLDRYPLPFGKVGDEYFISDSHEEDGPSHAVTIIHKGKAVKRVQGVTEEEAEAMGMGLSKCGFYGDDEIPIKSRKQGFVYHWRDNYGDKFPWGTNPWVFLIDVEVKE